MSTPHKVKKVDPAFWWKMERKATRKNISMKELRSIIEGERKAQLDCNGLDTDSNHAREMLERVWLIANGYEDRYQ